MNTSMPFFAAVSLLVTMLLMLSGCILPYVDDGRHNAPRDSGHHEREFRERTPRDREPHDKGRDDRGRDDKGRDDGNRDSRENRERH